jgi:hypothetical protein
MLEVLIVVVRALALALRGHRELVLDNLALRQQLAVVHRTTRCRLRSRDRLFGMALARRWRNWRTALIVVHRTPSFAGIAIGSAAAGRAGRSSDSMAVPD